MAGIHCIRWQHNVVPHGSIGLNRVSELIVVAIRFIQVSPICWGRLATKCPRCCGHLSQADSYLDCIWQLSLTV